MTVLDPTLSFILILYHLFLQRDAQDFVANLMNEEEAVGQVTSVPAFSRVNRQQQEAADGGLPSPASTSTAHRRHIDPTDDVDDDDDDIADDGDEEDGGLSELHDVDETGKLSLGNINSRRGRAGASSTSVGVGSGRINRGSLQDSDEDENVDEEEDADLFNAKPKRVSSNSKKSKG